jgi:hypothetical protein
VKDIKVSEIIGTNFENEDAILLRGVIKQYIEGPIVLDFAGIKKVPTTFLCCLFTDIINSQGRDYVASHINVKNMSNFTDYKRVVLGTAF